jgi:hypothetical protein
MHKRTYDTDEITLRRVYALSTNNQFVPAMTVLTADGKGGTYWAIPSTLGYNPSFNQIVTDAATFTANLRYNTLTLSEGGGIGFVEGEGTNQLYIYSKGFNQLNVAGGNSLYGFSSNVTRPTLNFVGAGGISLQANPATNTLTFTANGQPISTTLNSFQSLKVFPNLSTATGQVSSLSGYSVLSANNYSSILTLVGTGQISLTSDYNANAVFIGLNASTLITSNVTSINVSTTNVTTSSIILLDTYNRLPKNLYAYNGNLYLNGQGITTGTGYPVTSVNAGSNIVLGPSGTTGDIFVNVDTGFLLSTVAGLGTAGYISTATLLSTSAGLSLQIGNGGTTTAANLVSTANLAGLVSTANLSKLISTANLAELVSTANLSKLISTANLSGLVSTANLSKLISTANLAGLVSTANLSKLISTANLADLVSTANLADLVSTANLADLVSTANLADLVSTANLADLVSTANLADLVSTANLADLVSTANLADLVSTANLADLVSTANLAGLVSTANLANLLSTSFFNTNLTSTIIGLGTTGYISTATLLSTSAGLSIEIQSGGGGITTALTSSIIGLGTIGYVSTSYLNTQLSQIAVTNRAYWVVIGDSSIKYSYDGLHWLNTNGIFSVQGNAVAWNGSYWVAVGQDSSSLNTIQYSYDGQIWEPATNGGFTSVALGIGWNGSYWVAVGTGGTSATSIRYSYDGKTWVAASSGGFSNTGYAVAWNGFYWIAVGTGTLHNTIQISYNGKTWTGITTGGFASGGHGIAWNGSYWVAVGEDNSSLNSIQYSYDGLTWVAASSGGFASGGHGIAWNGSYWVAVGQDNNTLNSIQYSYDGKTWVAASSGGFIDFGNSVTWNGSYWIAVGQDTTNTIQYSYDGKIWTTVATGGFTTIGRGIAWSEPLFSPTLWSTNAYTYVITGNLTVTSSVTANNGFFSNGVALTSDRRIKTNITSADTLLCYSTVRDLSLHRFEYMSSFRQSKHDVKQIGFIADEVEKVFPKSIHTVSVNTDGFSTLKFVNFEQIQMAHFGATQYMASLLEQQSSTIVGQNASIGSLQLDILNLSTTLGIFMTR